MNDRGVDRRDRPRSRRQQQVAGSRNRIIVVADVSFQPRSRSAAIHSFSLFFTRTMIWPNPSSEAITPADPGTGRLNRPLTTCCGSIRRQLLGTVPAPSTPPIIGHHRHRSAVGVRASSSSARDSAASGRRCDRHDGSTPSDPRALSSVIAEARLRRQISAMTLLAFNEKPVLTHLSRLRDFCARRARRPDDR